MSVQVGTPTDEIGFQLLGPVRMWRDGHDLDLVPRQRRSVLALLLALAGRPATPADLIDLLWPEAPPTHARNLLHRHIGDLRRQWQPGLSARSEGRLLIRQGGGYRLLVDTDSLDLLRFRYLMDRARTDPAPGALPLFAEALSLWKGPVAADLAPESRAHPLFTAVDQEYSTAVADFARAALRHGQARIALSVLTEATDRDPFDEALLAQLILVLGTSGRQAEAVARFRGIRAHLDRELGVAPSKTLQEAYHRVLRQQFDVGETPRPALHLVPKPAEPDRQPVPAQLPPRLTFFEGRTDVLEHLSRWVAQTRRVGGLPIVALDGLPGVGKSALAVQLAHQLAPDHPDGQLYLDLRGYRGTEPAVKTTTALRDLLSGLGVRPGDIPEGRQAMTGLYRSLIHDRRILIVLDDARDQDQIEALLPGSPSCLVLVTSRRKMIRLRINAGARLISLTPPPPVEARALLTRLIGPPHPPASEIGAAIDAIGALPLAISVLAARTALCPGTSLPRLLRGSPNTQGPAILDEDDGAALRAAFDGSYRLLSEPAAGLFRRLARYPAIRFTASQAARAAELSDHETHSLLAEIVQVALITEHRPGHYDWHPLIQGYAAGLREAQRETH